jgi:hypothetical protein
LERRNILHRGGKGERSKELMEKQKVDGEKGNLQWEKEDGRNNKWL